MTCLVRPVRKSFRKSNEILFEQDGDILYPYQLSSGEKQILVILLTVLVQDNRRGVLFMDEPEVSLHVEWQQRLISLIRQLNPNVQIVLTTHSPAVIMDGWLDAVTEVSDITKIKQFSNDDTMGKKIVRESVLLIYWCGQQIEA